MTFQAALFALNLLYFYTQFVILPYKKAVIMSFEHTTEILSELPGLFGAIVINFEAKSLLTASRRNLLPIDTVVELCSDTIRYERNMLADLQLYDVMETMVTMTADLYHIYYIVPYFDNVLIYAVVKRATALPLILRALEQAGDAMRSY